jgi:serine/threonine protein kinase/tetratricopeptide (TPR) repeat protein
VTPERFQQIDRLVSLAQERDSTERASFLEEACAGDDDLRQRVEARLEAYQHLDFFLLQAPPALVAEAIQTETNRTSETIAHPPWSTGRSGEAAAPLVLNDRYVVERELGRGGMGRVLVGRDTKLNRKVAIKLLVAGLHDEQALRRFEQEARAAGSLNHPNVLVIHDIGLHEGQPYIVSELLEGGTLRERLSGTPLPIREAIDCAVQLAEGLAAAHAKGIVHRDLKPENLFITGDGRLKILDFGIAKLTEPKTPSADLHPEEGLQTQTGTILGTIGYMSPEQVCGRPADERSDLFSAGVILYEMLSGKRAFQRASRLETACAILEDEPSELPAQVAAATKEIVRRCLRKSPEERFQSARELAVQLRAVAKEPSLDLQRGSPATSTPLSARSAGARTRWIWGGSALAALGVLAALFAGLNPGWRNQLLGQPGLPRIESLAVLPLENFSGDPDQEYFADGMTEALIGELAQISSLKVISRTSVMRFKATRKPLPEVARELNVDGVVEGSVIRSGDRVRITAQLIHAPTDRHLWAQHYERDIRDVLSLQTEVTRAIANEIRAKLTPQQQVRLARGGSVDPEAYELYLKGRYFWNKRTEEDLRKGLEYFQQSVAKDPSYALAYVGIAESYNPLRYFGYLRSKEAGPKAKEAALRALEIDPTLGEAHTSLASTLFLDWDFSGAELEFNKGIQLNPNYAFAHHWYAQLLSWLRRTHECLAESRRAHELDPLSLPISTGLAHNLYSARQYDQAAAQLQKMLGFDPSFSNGHSLLGKVYEAQGFFEQAITEHEKAVSLSPSNPGLIADLGHAQALSGHQPEAERALQTLNELSKRKYVSPLEVAAVEAGLGQTDKAFASLERAYEDRSVRLAGIKANPVFDTLQSDPRYSDLVRRIGLPP